MLKAQNPIDSQRKAYVKGCLKYYIHTLYNCRNSSIFTPYIKYCYNFNSSSFAFIHDYQI